MRTTPHSPSHAATAAQSGRQACMAALLATLAATGAHATGTTGPATATVAEGALLGAMQADGVARFLGVPYAQPPVGALRWRAPQAAAAWSGQRDATRFGATCPQTADMFGPTSVNEDCLTLNVYAPQGAASGTRPVLVYIHGGGFWSGSGSYYDGATLARKTDAVVVTINYRLGVFGFLTTSGLTAENKAVNFGLQDQYLALSWVKRNIGAFGGDAGKVTIAGQSAGGGSVCLAMTSPLAAGLFDRGIMHSAPCTMGTTPMSKALTYGNGIATKAGCPEGAGQMACMRSKSVPELLAAAQLTTPVEALSQSFWPATIDGQVIPEASLSALAKGNFHKVPVMLGATQDEGRGLIGWGFHGIFGREVTQAEYDGAMKAFAGDLAAGLITSVYPAKKYGGVGRAISAAITDVAIACPTNNTSAALAKAVPKYAFEFADKQTPQFFADPFMPEGWGAYHAGDLLYIFQTPVSGLSFPGLDAAQLALSEQMLGYWRNFMVTGNPNEGPAQGASKGPKWPRYGKGNSPVQSLKPEGIVTLADGQYANAHKCGLWSSYYGLGAIFGMY
ncbi:MAG: Para-nitrobenzyl esterase [Pseudomonadota bacterium]